MHVQYLEIYFIARKFWWSKIFGNFGELKSTYQNFSLQFDKALYKHTHGQNFAKHLTAKPHLELICQIITFQN